MKWFRILTRSISSAFKSVFRNLSLSIASISCIIITLIIVAIAIVLSANVNNFTSDIENDLSVVVFAKRGISDEEAEKLKSDIEAVPNIENIEFKSKEEIRAEIVKNYEAFDTILNRIGEEPLQLSYIITVKDIKSIGETASTLKNLENVDTVKYGEGMVEELISIFDIIKKVMIIAVIALIIVTAFLISNTIKITIYSRKDDIDIMRLVGTSNIVIKLPFLFEGLFLGLFGSVIPILCTVYGYVFMYDKLGGKVFTDIITLIEPYNFVFEVGLALFIIGGVVGMFGSYKAVRKYLKI